MNAVWVIASYHAVSPLRYPLLDVSILENMEPPWNFYVLNGFCSDKSIMRSPSEIKYFPSNPKKNLKRSLTPNSRPHFYTPNSANIFIHVLHGFSPPIFAENNVAINKDKPFSRNVFNALLTCSSSSTFVMNNLDVTVYTIKLLQNFERPVGRATIHGYEIMDGHVLVDRGKALHKLSFAVQCQQYNVYRAHLKRLS